MSSSFANFGNELYSGKRSYNFVGAKKVWFLIAAVAARSGPLLRARLDDGFATLVPATAPLVGATVGVAVSATYDQVLHFRQVWALLALNAALFLWGRR